MKTIKHKGKLTRTFTLRDHKIDTEKRTIELSFSSESPVDRWFGTEILDHSPASVRLDRLNDGAALLVDHNTRDHVGVVESASVDNRRGRAVVRFGSSERATEIYNDVADGIRRLVSVGYRIHKMVNDGDPEDETFRATDWEPHEISIVAVPADASVGVGRTDEDIEYKIDVLDRVEPETKQIEVSIVDKKEAKPEVKVAPMAIEIREAAEKLSRDLTGKQLGEWQKIRETAKAHVNRELGEKAIEDGKSFDEFRTSLLDDYVGSVKPMNTSVDDPDLSQSDQKRYSLRKVLNHLSDPTNRQKIEAAAFELDVSKDIANRAEHEPQGVLIPSMAMRAVTLTAGTATDGAELVATNLLASSFVDVLRNRTKVMMLGARTLDGLVGDVAIPRKTSGSAGGWIATEGGNAAQTDPQFDQVTLTPKTVGTYAEYTRQLLKQSTPSIDGILQDDLQKALALSIDLAALEGTGANGQPTGLRQATGVLTSTIAAAGVPTWVEIVEFETDVASSNADVETMAWITRAEVRGSMKTTLKSAGISGYIMGEGNELNGYRAEISQQAVANGIYFGDWSQILIGMWGALDLLVDPYSNSLSGTVRVVALQSADVGIRHPEAFSINV